MLRAKEISGAAQFKVKFGDLEAVIGAGHRIEAALTFFGDFAAVHEHAI